MGIIDRAVYVLTCKKCGTTEQSSILDKGSVWGSAWNFSAHFSNFETSWTGGGATEPELTSVKCKKCGSTDIDVKSDYSPF